MTAVLLEDPPLFFGDEATYESTPFAAVFPLIQAAIDQLAGRRHDAPSRSPRRWRPRRR